MSSIRDPIGPEPYTDSELVALPVTHLERSVTVAPAMTLLQIAAIPTLSGEATPAESHITLTSGIWSIKTTNRANGTSCDIYNGDVSYLFTYENAGKRLLMQLRAGASYTGGPAPLDQIGDNLNTYKWLGIEEDFRLTVLAPDHITIIRLNLDKDCDLLQDLTLVRAD